MTSLTARPLISAPQFQTGLSSPGTTFVAQLARVLPTIEHLTKGSEVPDHSLAFLRPRAETIFSVRVILVASLPLGWGTWIVGSAAFLARSFFGAAFASVATASADVAAAASAGASAVLVPSAGRSR